MQDLSYMQARKDHEYLWSFGPAQDMSGGYVDQEDLAKLLKSPTRRTARACYCNQINYWFEAGPEGAFNASWQHGDWKTDERVREIARRHFVEEELDRLIAFGST